MLPLSKHYYNENGPKPLQFSERTGTFFYLSLSNLKNVTTTGAYTTKSELIPPAYDKKAITPAASFGNILLEKRKSLQTYKLMTLD